MKIAGLLVLALVTGGESRSANAAHAANATLLSSFETAGSTGGSATIVRKTVVVERKYKEKASISFPVVSMPGDQELSRSVFRTQLQLA